MKGKILLENKKSKPSIAIIGGDIRQLIVAKEFSLNGYPVKAFGFDSFENDYGNIEKCDDLNEAIANAKITMEQARPLRIPFTPKVKVEKAERKNNIAIHGFSCNNFRSPKNTNPKYPISTIKNHILTVKPDCLQVNMIKSHSHSLSKSILKKADPLASLYPQA